MQPATDNGADAAPADGRLTRAAYARLQGWNKSTVTRLVAQGRLVTTPDGKMIDVPASARRLEETKRIDRQGVREHHARTRGRTGNTPAEGAQPAPAMSAPAPETPGAGAAGEPPPPPATSDQEEYNRARAQKEAAQAQMAEMELARRRAELVDIAQVREMAARAAGIISRGFERIGPRIGPVWSVEQDPLKREQLLEDELRKVLHEWTDEIERLIGGAGG